MRKATAFRGRSEQDRSALFAVCCYVILETFRWNVSNGISLCLKLADTAQPVPTENDRKSIVQEQKDEEYKPPLKGEVGGKAARRGQFRRKIKTKKNCNVRTPQSVLRTASSY